MSTLAVDPITASFGAEIGYVDFSKPVPEEVIAEISSAIAKYGLLVFRSTGLDDKSHVAFARQFGELERNPGKSRFATDELTDQSNIELDGSLVSPDSPKGRISTGNQLFHVDSSFNARRATYSILRAVEIPPPGAGGNTDFADTRTAWDDLPDETKQSLLAKNYVGHHSFWHSRKLACPEYFAKLDPGRHAMSRHKLVQRHAPSGRMNLFVPSHVHHLTDEAGAEVDAAEAKSMIEELYSHAMQDKYVVSVAWKGEGDLIMWDNTCTLHRATPVTGVHRRDMRRATVLDGGQEAWGLNGVTDKNFSFGEEVMADVFKALSG